MKKLILTIFIFLLGMVSGVAWVIFDTRIHVESNYNLIMSNEDFARSCRDICYYNVMGQPYPGACGEVQTN